MAEKDKAFRERGVLPVFQTEQELRDSAFARYLDLVYGDAKTMQVKYSESDFPMDFKDFDMFYLSLLQKVGLDPKTLNRNCNACDLKPLDLYVGMTPIFDSPDSIFVWKTPPYAPAAPKTYVEVTHCADLATSIMEHTAMWCYKLRGSGIFVNTGVTRVYKDHPDAVSDILKKHCGDTQCVPMFDELFDAAQKVCDSVQFTEHADQRCMGARAVEIVVLKVGAGAAACPTDLKRFARGWRATDTSCDCDSAIHWLNCRPNRMAMVEARDRCAQDRIRDAKYAVFASLIVIVFVTLLYFGLRLVAP
jgi:hypothetical protein